MILLKLGGSLITDKNQRNTYRAQVAARMAAEIARVRAQKPDLPLIIGHGSGSFGHYEARQHNTINGVQTPEQWQGFARVATVAAELNHLVAKTFTDAGLPVLRLSPSASAVAKQGVIQSMSLGSFQTALDHQLIPLTHGDVAFDQALGGTIISTETVFTYLAQNLPVTQIILLGEVDGVYDENGQIIPHLMPGNLTNHITALGGSGGVDVTGGMLSKVQDMLALARIRPGLQVRICNGLHPGLLEETLLGTAQPGTLLTADD